MVKPLAFKGDKKPAKKRKRNIPAEDDDDLDPASKALNTNSTAADAPPEDDENWVSAEAITDIAGPVILVLPAASPISCVAADSLGKVFLSGIENMVEGEASTAEPHDVRQVWISQNIVGTLDKFTFKGHHGRYLGCDSVGVLSAAREAVSQEETFRCVEVEGKEGFFEIVTVRGTFVGVQGDALRGDVEETGAEEARVRVRMQARFKPKHKVEKAEKVRAKISRKELEDEVGRRLEDDEVKKLKKARREGNYHEAMLDVKVKGKHDKFA